MEKKGGRPRVELDPILVLQLIDNEDFGWLGAAREYYLRTRIWTCKDTIKRRYLEAKAASKPSKSFAEELAEEIDRRLKKRWLNQ